MQQRNVGNALIAVARYFGGIKLGAGGLVRAYGQAAGRVLDQTPLTPWTPAVTLTLSIDYDKEAMPRKRLAQSQGALLAREPEACALS